MFQHFSHRSLVLLFEITIVYHPSRLGFPYDYMLKGTSHHVPCRHPGCSFSRVVWVTRADNLTFRSQGPKVVVYDYITVTGRRGPWSRGIPNDGGQTSAQIARLNQVPLPSWNIGHWSYCFHFLKMFNSCDQTLKAVSGYTFGVCIHNTSEVIVWNLENVWLHPKLKCTQKN